MASATSELAQKLARRRAGEQVFETVASQSSADVVAEYIGGVRMEGGHETVFESVAASSVADASCTLKQVEGSPSSQRQASEAFAAALERIRAFEQAQVATDSTRSRSASSFSQNFATNRSENEEKSTEVVGDRSSFAPVSADIAAAEDKVVVQRERQQVDFKSAVRDRFMALLQEGLPPNEAAARAIREAAGQPSDAGDDAADWHVVSSSNCASSAQHQGVAISVAA